MRLIEIKQQENGSHNNVTWETKGTPYEELFAIPDGWAVIPEDMVCENFPFGEVTVSELDGVMTVTSWTPGAMPEPEPAPEPSPTLEARVAALETDAAQAANDRAALMLLLTGVDSE